MQEGEVRRWTRLLAKLQNWPFGQEPPPQRPMDLPQPRVGSTAEISASAASRRWGTMFFVTFASGTCGAWLTVGPNTFPYTKSVPYLKCPISGYLLLFLVVLYNTSGRRPDLFLAMSVYRCIALFYVSLHGVASIYSYGGRSAQGVRGSVSLGVSPLPPRPPDSRAAAATATTTIRPRMMVS